MQSSVTVRYPFHPLANHTLPVLRWPRRPDQAVTVAHPDGTAMKVPLWMVQDHAAHLTVGEQALLPASTLRALVELLCLHASSMAATKGPPETRHDPDSLPLRRQPAEPA